MNLGLSLGGGKSFFQISHLTFGTAQLNQGDQIWRIFAYRAIFFFGQFFNITKVFSPKIRPIFVHGKNAYYFFYIKIGWAPFWTIFFTNSSGHPELNLQNMLMPQVCMNLGLSCGGGLFSKINFYSIFFA
jgi:hypothetical protein